MRRKRAFSLLEIMVVIFLIGLIGSVIGINMKGGMEQGKKFKTEHAQRQLGDVLNLLVAEGAMTVAEAIDPAQCRAKLIASGLVKDVDKMMKDGWNRPFYIHADPDGLICVDVGQVPPHLEHGTNVAVEAGDGGPIQP